MGALEAMKARSPRAPVRASLIVPTDEVPEIRMPRPSMLPVPPSVMEEMAPVLLNLTATFAGLNCAAPPTLMRVTVALPCWIIVAMLVGQSALTRWPAVSVKLTCTG